MKKRSIISFILVLSLILLLVGCGDEHNFSETWTNDDISHWHVCTDKDCTEVSGLENHVLGEFVVVKEATDTEDGEKTATCSVCGYVKKVTIEKTTHAHHFDTEWSSDEVNHWHKCNVDTCNEKTDFGPHNFGEYVVTKNPTANDKGEKSATCTDCGFVKTEEIDKLSVISDVLGSQSNTNAEFEGVVFGLTSEGFFVFDTTGAILVKLANSQIEKLATVKVKDKVLVSGKYIISNNQPFIKNAIIEVLSSDNEVNAPVASTLDGIISQAATDKSAYGKLYKVEVAVSKDSANRIVLSDNTGSILVNEDLFSALEKYIDKKIKIDLVLEKMGDGIDGWISYAFVESIEEIFVDIDSIKEQVFEVVTVPAEVVGKLELMTKYAAEPGIDFIWSVKSGNAISITNNVCDVNISINSDEECVLLLTIKSGDKIATKEYTTVVKAFPIKTIAEGKLITDAYSCVSGLVVARGIADEKSQYHYIIVMDETTKELCSIDVDSDTRRTVVPGDRIDFIAKYRSDERPSFVDVKAIRIKENIGAIDYESLNPVRLEFESDYQYAIDNNHEDIVLYKIINPFMVGSGSTSYSWNQFGVSKSAAASGLINERQFSLLIANFSENGLTGWENEFSVPTKAEGAKAYPGTVMYVYSVYQTGNTKWSFIIPGPNACFYDEAAAVRFEVLQNVVKEVTCEEAGKYNIINEVVLGDKTYQLSWTSSDNTLIDPVTGDYPQLVSNKVAVLTCKYTINDVEYSFDVNVNMIAKEVEAISVSEAIANGSGEVAKLQAYVAAIGTSSENSEEYRYGLMLTDGKKVIYYATTDYVVNGVELKANDLVEITGSVLTVNNDGQMLKEGVIRYISSDNNVDYSELNIEKEVSSEDELSEFLAGHNSTHGLVVKFTGVFYFVGTGSSSQNARYQLNYKNAGNSAGSRYAYADGERSLVFSMPASKLLIGTNWWEDCGMPEKSGSKSYVVEGTIYAVGGYNGTTLHAWTIINKDGFKVGMLSTNTLIKNAIDDSIVSNEISANEAGTLELVKEVIVNDVTYPITWTSSNNEVLNAETGAYPVLTSDETVTLTATYTVEETSYTFDVVIELKAKEIEAISVSEAIALGNGEIVRLQAYIASIGASSENQEVYNKGLMLTDGKKVIYYKDAAFTCGDVTLKAHDLIEVSGATLTVDEDGQVLEGGVITYVSSDNVIDYSNLEVTVTVSSDEELAAFLAGHKSTHGLVVKFTGSFYFVGASATGANSRYQLNYRDAQGSTEARYTYADGERSLAFSIPNTRDFLGRAWWEDCGMPEISSKTSFAVEGTLYAVGGYNGKTLHAWTLINKDGFNVAKPFVGNKINKLIEESFASKEILTDEAGTLTLTNGVTVGDTEYHITWTSSNNEVLNAETGAYPVLASDETVTLTATYTVEETSYTFDVVIELKAKAINSVTVSEAIALGNGEIVRLQAYIASIGASSENQEVYNKGLMLTDGKKVIYYKDAAFTCGDVTLKAHDLIFVSGATLTVDEDGQVLEGGVITYVSSDNVIDYSNLEVTVTVSSDEELAAFLAGHKSTHGLVVKFTGSFYFVGTGSKVENARYQLNYKDAQNSAGSRYVYADGERSLAFSMPNTRDFLGRAWWEDCDMPEKSGSKSFAVEGTLYAVGGYNGKTLHAWTLINKDGFDVKKPQ